MQNFNQNVFINSFTNPYIEYVTAVKGDTTYGYKVETARRATIYKSPKTIEMIRSLSKAGRELYHVLPYWLNENYEYVIITQDKCVVEFGKYSERKLKDTIAELQRNCVLAPKDRSKGSYWFNPALFFRGNRIKQYKQCALKVASKPAKVEVVDSVTFSDFS